MFQMGRKIINEKLLFKEINVMKKIQKGKFLSSNLGALEAELLYINIYTFICTYIYIFPI